MVAQPKNIGQRGLQLIQSFEGVRLKKYQDAVGKWTIGYGHLILPSEQFEEPITQQEADVLLRNDLIESQDAIHNCVKVTLNQNRFDALVSLVFNIGIGNLRQSSLLWLLNQEQYANAGKQFLRWNKAGGKILAGLTRRRIAESELFLSAE